MSHRPVSVRSQRARARIPAVTARRCRELAYLDMDGRCREAGLVTLKEFAFAAEMSIDVAWKRLQRLCAVGLAERIGRGIYRLSDPKEPTP